MRTIVIAWATKTARFGAWEGHAALWLAEGTHEDERSAAIYAQKEVGRFAMTFETTDRQWREKAKAEAVEQALVTEKVSNNMVKA